MEGIRDGRAVDDCFYCALLYPERFSDDCPRCGRRMRYQPATLPPHPEPSVAALVAAYQRAKPAGRRPALERLLEHLHRHGPAALAALDALAARGGPDLDRLRQDHQALLGD